MEITTFLQNWWHAQAVGMFNRQIIGLIIGSRMCSKNGKFVNYIFLFLYIQIVKNLLKMVEK